MKKIIKVATKANKPMCDSSNANPCVYFHINFINQKEPKTVIHHTNNTNARFIFENSEKAGRSFILRSDEHVTCVWEETDHIN